MFVFLNWSCAYLEAGVLVAKQPSRQFAELRVAGQFQPLHAAQVVKDGGRKSAQVVLGEGHVAHGLQTAEDLARQPGDVGPGQVERQQAVAHADERLRTDSVAEVVSLQVQLHHLQPLFDKYWTNQDAVFNFNRKFNFNFKLTETLMAGCTNHTLNQYPLNCM